MRNAFDQEQPPTAVHSDSAPRRRRSGAARLAPARLPGREKSPAGGLACPPIPQAMQSPDIHPTAVVAATAELGEDVSIGPCCVVGPRVRLGARTRLHAHVVISGDTWLGADCEVFPFAALGMTPQDKKLGRNETGGQLRIGRHNLIREHVTIHGGTPFSSGVTRIGDHNMLLAGSHVGHDATVGSHVVFTNGAMAGGHTWIADRAILGAMVGLHQFARIGELAMVGAGAMVSQDVPPFALVQGDRARICGVNLVGLARHRYTPEQRAVIKQLFRSLFWRHGPMRQKLELMCNSPFAREPACQKILDFVSSSKRGLCMPRNLHAALSATASSRWARGSPTRSSS
jgi:UDP-N-acetylglucosamine acyltransferase